MPDDSGGTSASDAARADRGKATGSFETIIDKEVTGRQAIADSSTAERKERQQVEQRLKEREQLKVQNWRGRSMRWSHVSDYDSQRHAVKSNDFLYIGQLKLTVSVCPRWHGVPRYDEQTRQGMVDALDSQEHGVDRQRWDDVGGGVALGHRDSVWEGTVNRAPTPDPR